MRYQVVDCRWELGAPGRGRGLYLAAHVPGASFLDLDEDLSDLSVPDAGRHPLPSAERFAAAAGRAGIGAGVFVVAYGSLGGAERLWWLLRHLGHDDCAVLLGGIDAWGGELRGGEEEVVAAELAPRERSGDTIEADELVRRLADPALALVDARPASRWRGEPNEIDDPPGRIPGAVNAPWADSSPSCRPGSWSPIAAPASPPASRSTAPRSPAARGGSTRAPGASGRSGASRSSVASRRRRTSR